MRYLKDKELEHKAIKDILYIIVQMIIIAIFGAIRICTIGELNTAKSNVLAALLIGLTTIVIPIYILIKNVVIAHKRKICMCTIAMIVAISDLIVIGPIASFVIVTYVVY